MTDFDKISECVNNFRDSLLRALGAPPYVARPLPGAPLAAPGETAGTAAAMPGVSPAATPAAYVPKPAKSGDAAYVPQVGDKVRGRDYADDAEAVVVEVEGDVVHVRLIDPRGGHPRGHNRSAYYSYIRPASPSERAAAGLPVDEAKESAVDRVALAKALWRSWNGDDDVGYSGEVREGYVRAADAAIAFMAKAPAFDRAEFDEAKEREAAKVAVSRDAGDDFTRGWLARARVAAEGGPDAR